MGKNRIRLILFLLLVLSVFSTTAQGGEHVPDMSGVSLNLGYTYDPSDTGWFSQVSVFKLYDYDKIWPHKAPDAFRFKLEASLGGSRLDNSDIRLNASMNIFALYYLTGLENGRSGPILRPASVSFIRITGLAVRITGLTSIPRPVWEWKWEGSFPVLQG